MENNSQPFDGSEADELLDIVDSGDHVIGQQWRSQIYREEASNFRVVNAFLKDLQGRLWIPRRSAAKRIFPLCLDMSMGGHVASGENYHAAFVRELQEELNLDACLLDWRILGRLTPQTHGVSAFMTVYEIRSDQPPVYNRADFCEAFWLTPDEMLAVLANGDKAKDDLPRLVRFFYS
jgi:isopentenyl-diphosphate delta-isomerase